MKNKPILTTDFAKKNPPHLKHLPPRYRLTRRVAYAMTFFIFMAFNTLFAQQDIRLSGLVVLQNSGYRTGKVAYVSGAFVRSPLAPPTASDREGRFTLLFSDKPTGDVVNVSVRKAGLEVVNRKELENAVVGRLSPLKIVMSNPEELDDNRAAYYEISRTRADKRYENRLSALKKEGKSRQRVLDSLSLEFNRKVTTAEEAQGLLVQQRDQLQKQAQELAERFVVVNLDDESDTYRRAFRFFTEGAIEKAVGLLDSLNLTKRLADNTTIVEKSDKIIVETQSTRDKAADQIREDIRSSLLNAQLHRSLFQFSEANKNYSSVVRYDSLNIDYLNEYTQFLWDYGEYRLALATNARALRLARARVANGDSLGVRRELAYALHYRQLLMKVDGKKDSLKLACLEAMPLLESLIPQDSAHLFTLVEVVENLAQVNAWTGNDSLSTRLYRQAFDLLPSSVSPRFATRFLYNKSFILGGISGSFQDQKQLDSALVYGQESVVVAKELLKHDTFRYAIQVSKMLNNVAAVYQDSNEDTLAIALLIEAQRYVNLVSQMKPKESNKEIARLQLGLFVSYLSLNNLNEAANQLNKVHVIAQNELSVGENNPQLIEAIWRYRSKMTIRFLTDNQSVSALANAEKMRQLVPSDDSPKALLATTLIFNNQYDRALTVFQTVTDRDEIKEMLAYFERNQLRHNDFARIRAHFGLN